MANPTEPRREHASTYFVQDRSSKKELNRLRIQDQVITTMMGGVFPEQPEPESFHRVLDVGCGPGGWLLDAAQAYPALSLFGIDISTRMIEYAQKQSEEQGVASRIEFRVMDALHKLEFPNDFFDLVNMRASLTWMRTWDWPNLLSEMRRVTRPGGVVRLTEPDAVQPGSSQGLTRFSEAFQCALFNSGHLFEDESTGLTAHLAPLLHRHGVREVQTRAYPLTYRAGTPQVQAIYEDAEHLFHTARPFLQKWSCFPADYDEICQQTLREMQQNDFYVTWNFLTAWGQSS